MRFLIPLDEVSAADRPLVGEKCLALSRLRQAGFTVPPTVCVTTAAYADHVDRTGLRERIQLELNRRDLKDMRWEELWDASLRIRNMFLRTEVSDELAAALLETVAARAGSGSVVVRSSAPGEDAPGSSFAGLHESFVNVRGGRDILDHLLLVWASLWSDAALLYRRELGLDLEKSAMAVAIQRFVEGRASGVLFSVSPADRTRIGIEAVHGLNEGLVDGSVEPHRWAVDRRSRRVVAYQPSAARRYLRAGAQGTVLADLPGGPSTSPPLGDAEVAELADTALRAEEVFGAPQDMEWTIAAGRVYLLQSRPITALAQPGEDDSRGWYLSLRRSLGNLRLLKGKLEEELMPSMREEAARLRETGVEGLADGALATEIRRRIGILRHWEGTYREYCIPFAHGMRLFGQVYNKVMRPRDPYEFMDLLGGEKLESLERNRALQAMAARLRAVPALAAAVAEGDEEAVDDAYREEKRAFIRRFGDLSCRAAGHGACGEETRVLDLILLEMSRHPPRQERRGREGGALVARFLDAYPGGKRKEGEELLDIARASYRLRDNDNIYLGRIETEVAAAAAEGARRLRARGAQLTDESDHESVASLLEGSAESGGHEGRREASSRDTTATWRERPRQLVGQPAGPGLGKGVARVIRRHSDLSLFRHGEVLVCDAVDPNMTFVAPLAEAVVERRGGMLIHGAIIAREYGLPCVTGIAGATSLIRSGDTLTVDGYLGIVTLEAAE